MGNCAHADDFERTVWVRSAPVRMQSAQPHSAELWVRLFLTDMSQSFMNLYVESSIVPIERWDCHRSEVFQILLAVTWCFNFEINVYLIFHKILKNE